MAKEKPAGAFKLSFKLPNFKKKNEKSPLPKSALPRLKLVFFIVDWSRSHEITEICEEEKVRFHFITKGRGTASSDVLDLLGIGSSDKAVIVGVEQGVLIPVLFKEVRKKLRINRSGTGIAFSIPLSGINTPLLKVFKESINKNEKIYAKGADEMSDEENMVSATDEIKNELIIAVINQGYSDEYMTVAREAGARGGTVISARGLAHQGPVKFFGVSVQDEKEIVLVLTDMENKLPIMEAVSRSCGITTQAEGIVFSLPVDNVMGLNLE